MQICSPWHDMATDQSEWTSEAQGVPAVPWLLDHWARKKVGTVRAAGEPWEAQGKVAGMFHILITNYVCTYS